MYAGPGQRGFLPSQTLLPNIEARCLVRPDVYSEHQQEQLSGEGWGVREVEPHGRLLDTVTYASHSKPYIQSGNSS